MEEFGLVSEPLTGADATGQTALQTTTTCESCTGEPGETVELVNPIDYRLQGTRFTRQDLDLAISTAIVILSITTLYLEVR